MHAWRVGTTRQALAFDSNSLRSKHERHGMTDAPPCGREEAMNARIRGYVLLGGLLLGCLDSRGLAGPSLSDADELVLQIVPQLDWRTLADDDVVITAAAVHGRVLELSLQFGGGCRTHRFALVAGTEFGESNPPYTVFRLAHDADGDPCDALLQKTLTVDLDPIVPLVQQGGVNALRFQLLEPGERPAGVGELLLSF
jgi:hypothetical protein